MRTDKLLANTGYGSRKEVKKLLKKGGFTVNGEVVKDGKVHVDPEKDTIEVFGEPVKYKEFVYLLMNKPKGYVSATEDAKEKTVIDLLEPEEVLFQPFPVGRLDKDTTGLLLLTNDGKLAHQLTSPKKKVDKTYLVHLDAPVSQVDIDALESGVTLDDGYKTKPATIDLVDPEDLTVVKITIQEGKFHQVKRMFITTGNKVIDLKRERMGSLYLDPHLERGSYRELTGLELAKLQKGE
ncbi:16S rRNA pseudouridine(516) synthase [Salipaludibacillus keqinensis]|uniref:Pseudouridine synthase n=1 Tax=Salipaludibacillus keqinensis TaxID=2045207 RepID=A0A323TIP3_9BACI|nr:pseudouridine synthase [Salipaludibacillus keqinensis]PYZ93814.1 16S rRNA pseudouridine(516) synthase [Salipaludibacillus keqinensis]